MKLRNLMLAAVGLAMTLGAADAASANVWQRNHPGRVEVNHRLGNINHSIFEARRHGDISYREARVLRRRDRDIRIQERVFARHNGGHLTRSEWARLNREENNVRHHI
jgi:hypothetical protein